MRDTVYFLVFDGYADWQAALALCEIRRPGDWQVQAVGFSMAPVTSMGGLAVQPERTLAQIDLARAALLILPGGHLWSRGEGLAAVAAARRVHAAGAPVAGIADGVLALARAGLLDHCRHTGNHAGHIDAHVPDYRGAEQYDATVLAVSDGGTLTASEFGSVEFAREVIRTLDLYNASDREHWFRLYKHAMPPPWLAGISAAAA
ncbi:MAG: type 1 glutamine amidotransferase family protein [Rhodanobacter sp.]